MKQTKRIIALTLCLITLISCFVSTASAEEIKAKGYPFIHVIEETKTVYYTKGDTIKMTTDPEPNKREIFIFNIYRLFLVSIEYMARLPYITKGYKQVEVTSDEFEFLYATDFKSVLPPKENDLIPNYGGG